MDKKNFYTLYFYSSLYSPIIFTVFLSYFAIKERSVSIFIDFWWIVLLACMFGTLFEYLARCIKIDFTDKSILIRNSFNSVKILSGDIKEIYVHKGQISKLIYLENNKQKEEVNAFPFYGLKNRKTIADTIVKLNSSIKVINE